VLPQDLHRAARGNRLPSIRPSNDTSGSDRPSSWPGAGWSARAELRQTPVAPSQQGYAATRGASSGTATSGGAAGCWHRRLGDTGQGSDGAAVGKPGEGWKRGHRYGTIICDLERRRVIDILPDREAATVTAWLAERPTIEVIARDRGAGYMQAATQGRPGAVQVADRWHLMENVSAAFLTGVQQSMPAIRAALGARLIDPTLLTCAERRQHAGWLRREEENARILMLAKQGVAIKEIVRRTGRSRKVVRQVVRGGRADVFRSRVSSLDGFVDDLEIAWLEGCHNGAELWRRLITKGFAGSLRVVTEWAELLKVPPAEPVELQRRGRASVTRTRWHRPSRVCASHPPHAASRA
jgi:transposase